jgi:hypothetical protein
VCAPCAQCVRRVFFDAGAGRWWQACFLPACLPACLLSCEGECSPILPATLLFGARPMGTVVLYAHQERRLPWNSAHSVGLGAECKAMSSHLCEKLTDELTCTLSSGRVALPALGLPGSHVLRFLYLLCTTSVGVSPETFLLLPQSGAIHPAAPGALGSRKPHPGWQTVLWMPGWICP